MPQQGGLASFTPEPQEAPGSYLSKSATRALSAEGEHVIG